MRVYPVAALLALAAAPSLATPADEREIAAGERAWGQAYLSGDVATVTRLLANDFRGIDTHGRAYDKAQVIADVRVVPHSHADRVEELVTTVRGNVAIAQARELGVGAGPEFHPTNHVFTDTWLKTAAGWRIIAAEDLDAGLASPPAFVGDEGVIRSLRAASNRALAAHDLDTFAPVFAEDAAFVWSDGSSSPNRASMLKFFRDDFAATPFVTFVRSPSRVSVSDRGVRAAEHGAWTAIKRNKDGETRYGGDYLAHWAKETGGWQVRGETYVKLYCGGSLCKP